MTAGVATTCEECEGKRFQASVLEHHLGGRDISEVLAMSVTEAAELFCAGEAGMPAAHAVLDRLAEVGLGQPQPRPAAHPRCPAASGSGSSRPPEWSPTVASTSSTSRPPACTADVEQLLCLLDRLVDSGKSVIVIEHHQAVMAHAEARTGEHLAAYVVGT